MSKRYVIQVETSTYAYDSTWETVQHPSGGDWKTRSRTTAITDAARLVQQGETRELRVMESKPVFELVEVGVSHVDIVEAAKSIHNSYADEDEDQPQFELVGDSHEADGYSVQHKSADEEF